MHRVSLLQKNNRKKGFTLVEVLVSVTIFTVVAIVGITAVIVAKSAYEKNQAIRATSDSLMFILDDISRTARLGDYYRCIDQNLINLQDTGTPLDGQNCRGVSFEPFWNIDPDSSEDQLIYIFAETVDPETNESMGALFARSLDDQSLDSIDVSGESFQRITPRNINIDISRSGFDIIGAEDFTSQPRIIMRIYGEIVERNQTTQISLQTTISQRAIRVEP